MNKPAPISVFIIEDSPLFAYWLSTEMESRHNYRIFSYLNAEEALADLKNIKPKIVLLDYHLGKGMNGKQALTEIKRMQPDTRVAILSNETDLDIVVDLMKEGAINFVRKNKTAISEFLNELN